MVEAQKSPKQRQISSSVLLPTLWMGTATVLWLCGSVDINNIVWCRAIMHGFYNYSGTSPVSWPQPSDGAAPCCALKAQPVGVSERQNSERRSRSGTHTRPVESRLRPRVHWMCVRSRSSIPVPAHNTWLHAATCGIIIVLAWSVCFHDSGRQKSSLTLKSYLLPSPHHDRVRQVHPKSTEQSHKLYNLPSLSSLRFFVFCISDFCLRFIPLRFKPFFQESNVSPAPAAPPRYNLHSTGLNIRLFAIHQLMNNCCFAPG